MTLLDVLNKLELRKTDGSDTPDWATGQLLWAARGRTPHLYNSKPWGLTIPTWAGKQDISSLYFINDGAIYKYINRDISTGRPTHSIQHIVALGVNEWEKVRHKMSPHQRCIFICRNENYDRALWEVGYQLLNLVVPANAIGIGYKATLLDREEKLMFTKL